MSRMMIVAAVAAMSCAGSAEAQTRYFARERIVGLPTAVSSPPATQYPGKWSAGSTWTTTTACASKMKTESAQPMCTGGECDPATRPAPTTRQTACRITCAPMVLGQAANGVASSLGTATNSFGQGSTSGFPDPVKAENIRQACENYGGGIPIACEWVNGSAFVWYAYRDPAPVMQFYKNSERMASSCTYG